MPTLGWITPADSGWITLAALMWISLGRLVTVPWTAWYAKSRFEAQNDLGTCDGCQDCIERCQFDALTMEKVEGHRKLKAIVDPENCMGCGVCVLACEPGSLKMAIVRPPEHIPHPSRHRVEAHSHAG